jgi:hypothetical protein
VLENRFKKKEKRKSNTNTYILQTSNRVNRVKKEKKERKREVFTSLQFISAPLSNNNWTIFFMTIPCCTI